MVKVTLEFAGPAEAAKALLVLTTTFATLSLDEAKACKPEAFTPAADPAPATATAKPARPKKSAPSDATAPPATSASTDTPVAVTASASAPTAAATSTSKDDVRAALVAAQTRLGGKDKPRAVLEKYAKPATIDGLPLDKYQTVIDECAALT